MRRILAGLCTLALVSSSAYAQRRGGGPAAPADGGPNGHRQDNWRIHAVVFLPSGPD